MASSEERFAAIRREYDRVRGAVASHSLNGRVSGRGSALAHVVLQLTWVTSAQGTAGRRYPAQRTLESAVRRKLAAVHPQRIRDGEGAEAAGRAAAVLRAYYERSRELLDPSFLERAERGDGESRGAAATLVERPVPPYGASAARHRTDTGRAAASAAGSSRPARTAGASHAAGATRATGAAAAAEAARAARERAQEEERVRREAAEAARRQQQQERDARAAEERQAEVAEAARVQTARQAAAREEREREAARERVRQREADRRQREADDARRAEQAAAERLEQARRAAEAQARATAFPCSRPSRRPCRRRWGARCQGPRRLTP